MCLCMCVCARVCRCTCVMNIISATEETQAWWHLMGTQMAKHIPALGIRVPAAEVGLGCGEGFSRHVGVCVHMCVFVTRKPFGGVHRWSRDKLQAPLQVCLECRLRVRRWQRLEKQPTFL